MPHTMPQSSRTTSINNPFHPMAGAASIARRIFSFSLTFLLAMALPATCFAFAGPDGPPAAHDYGKVPLSFEPNRGQTDSRVQYFSRGPGYGIFLTPSEAVLSLQKPVEKQGTKPVAAPTSSVLRMSLPGANAASTATPQDQLQGTSNYFFGSSAKKWATDVPTYGKVSFANVYAGVDLLYYGNQRQLEYDFVVSPNADPQQIALAFTGAIPKLNANGDLLLATPGGEASFHKPVVYQTIGNQRVPVEAAYLIAKDRVTFALGPYDHSKTLVIDPVLTYGTFLGGSLDDRGFAVQADAAGNAYLVGDTVSLNFPLVNAYQTTNHDTSNGWVVYASKLNPAGNALIYSTFIGGVADSHALGAAVDAAGSVYIGGYTSAGDFPVTSGSFQTICGGSATNINGVHARANGCSPSGDTNGFVVKLSPAGNSLTYSTFLGGGGFNQVTSIAIDAAGEAYLGGNTNANCGPGPYWTTNHTSPDSWNCFPVTSGANQSVLNGQTVPGSTIWGFFSKLSSDGSSLLYSTEILAPRGTTASNTALSNTIYAVAVDAAGNGYVAGAGGYGLPTTSGAFYVPPVNTSTALPPYPAYVAKFNPSASGAASLVYSTFIGSAAQTVSASNYTNTATALAVDASGDAIVAGYTATSGCGFPTTAGVYQASTNYGPYCSDGFVTKLNSTGTGLVWSTILGSTNGTTQLTGLAVGSNGNLYLSGNSGNSGFPLVGALHAAPSSGGGIVAELSPTANKLIFSTYTGGFGNSGYSGGDTASAIAVDTNGNMYVTGKQDANTLSIPTTAGALQTTYQGGSYDAYVLKIAPALASATTLTVPASATAGQPVALSASVAGPAGTTTIPTGTITFLSGSTTLGTGTLNTSGVATYTASGLNATTYNITASYPGDTNFAASVSSAKALVVTPATPSLALTVPATANVGSAVAMSVTITGTGGTPSGTVVFKDGTTTLATQTLASGAASYSTSTLAVGAHSITASYSGDSIFASAVSSAQTVTVSLLTPSVALTVPATAVVGASVALSVTVTGTGGTPTGSVIFKDGTTTLATQPLTAGATSYTTTALAVGAHSITATYSGDSTFASVVSSIQTVTITVAPAITWTATPTSLTITHGLTGTIVITGSPVGGYTGTSTFSCGTLPTAVSCTFSPTSLVFSGNNTPQSTTLTISTSLTKSGFNAIPTFGHTEEVLAALLLVPMGFAGLRRKNCSILKLTMFLAIASSTAILGLAGCSSGTSGSSTVTTPAGSYTIAVTITSSNANTTINVPVTVQ